MPQVPQLRASVSLKAILPMLKANITGSGLVLFFCTFLAMKAEDSENRQRSTDDWEQRGEDLRFSG